MNVLSSAYVIQLARTSAVSLLQVMQLSNCKIYNRTPVRRLIFLVRYSPVRTTRQLGLINITNLTLHVTGINPGQVVKCNSVPQS